MSRDPVVVVPGDLDVEDRIAGPITFRMAAWLAAAVAGAALVAAGRGAIASTALGLVLLVVGVAGAWWRPGGRPIVAWVAPLLAFRKRRRAYAPATAAEDDTPEPVAVEPEPEPTAAPPPPDTEPTSTPVHAGAPSTRRRFTRVVAGAVAGAAVLAAAVFTASRGRESAPTPHVVEVVAPEPTANPPVVVVVPVDPFTGWQVGDDVNPFCGC